MDKNVIFFKGRDRLGNIFDNNETNYGYKKCNKNLQ